MPVIFEYLLKLSISIAVIHLFYLLVLRRLTFYNLNRWYLAGYTALCFAIPFVDVSAITAGAGERSVVHIIPTVQAISGKAATRPMIEVSQATDWWQVGLYVLAAGSAVLLLRLAGQLFALRKIKRTATAISDGDTPIYHTDKEITPFSFGNNIYINKNLHTEAELEEIILHEYVHVKQLHTFDIILAELLCIINWYNPFAWFMRHSIRQNLEYIADDNVVNTGVDKKAYQYHLLKVIGVPQYRIANQFNFSSLKNRIMMMNKVRSAKINLLKFMFILPLLAVILVAFRNQLLPEPKGEFTYAIVFYDIDTHQRLSDVEVKEIYGNKTYKADTKGYTAMPVNIQKDKALHISLSFKKSGYLDAERRFQYPVYRKQERSVIELIGLSKTKNANCKECDKFSAYMQPSANLGSDLKHDADEFFIQLFQETLKYALVFYDFDTGELIDNVSATMIGGKQAIQSDDQGYLLINAISKQKKLTVNLTISKAGYVSVDRIFSYQFRGQNNTIIEALALRKQAVMDNCKSCDTFDAHLQVLSTKNTSELRNEAKNYYEQVIKERVSKTKKVVAKMPEENISRVSIPVKKDTLNKPEHISFRSDKAEMKKGDDFVSMIGKATYQDNIKNIVADTIKLPKKGHVYWSSALILIDDKESQIEDLRAFNPGDISSIEVLKDASATAIYGSRAMYGVVKVQTKKAIESKKF